MSSQKDIKLIEKLKKMLVSRDSRLQLSAVKFIHQNLKSLDMKSVSYDALVEFLITNDICVYLGEACNTPHLHLLKQVMNCLQKLSKTKIFYKKTYVCLVTSSIIRATHSYLKEYKSENVVKCFIYLLSEIFCCLNNLECTPIISVDSPFDSAQILNLLEEIVDKTPPEITFDTLLVASKVLHSMVSEKNNLKLNPKTLKHTLVVMKKFLMSLGDILIENTQGFDINKYFCCTFGMICHLSIDGLFISNAHKVHSLSGQKILKYNNDDNNCELENYKLPDLLQVTYKIMTFLILKIKTYESKIDFHCYGTFMKLINMFFHEPSFNENLPEFAKVLSNNEFLVFFPIIRSRSTDKNFRKLCQMNLAELLIILSYQKFNFSKWSGGKISFRNHIYEGLLDNEEDLNDWPKIIFDKCSTDSKLNALIVFLYFYCTSQSCSKNLEKALLPHVIYYVLGIPSGMRCPTPIAKCLWLIFAIASSHEFSIKSIKCEPLTVESANEKLVKLISPYIKEVYTHHPAIIKWAYSSTRIPYSVQNDVLQLWLENEKILPSSLATLSSVWWTLLDIIQNGIESVVQDATNILKYCLENTCDEKNAIKLKMCIWKTLPDLMGHYIENKIQKEETLRCFLDLCTSQIPNQIELNIVHKSAFFLIEILPTLNKNNLDLMASFMTEAFCLLKISLKQESSNVLSLYLSSDTFKKSIENAIMSPNNKLSIMAYNISSFATLYQGRFNINCEKSIVLHPYMIVKLLKNDKFNEKCCAVLQTIFTSFHILLTHPNIIPLVKITSEHAYESKINCFRTLFFRLQMSCCKDSNSLSEGSWQCMNKMLQFSVANKNNTVTIALANNPWTHILIKYYLHQNKPENSHKKFLIFTYNWLMCLKIIRNQSKTNQPLNKFDILTKTLALLVQAFNEQTRDALTPEKKAVANNIFNLINTF